MNLPPRSRLVLALALVLSAVPAAAAEPAPAPTTSTSSGSGAVVTQNPDGTATVSPSTAEGSKPAPDLSKVDKIRLNFPQDSSLLAWVKFFADVKHMNFIISDVKELENKKITIISNQAVNQEAAWEAFLSALEQNGYALTVTNKTARLVKVGSPGSSTVGHGVPRETDAYVTQLIELQNTRVDDMAKIIQGMVGPDAKIVAYPPTNTMIITDTGANVRKVYQVMQALDVASPKSTMVIYPMRFADASDVKAIIEQLYGVAEDSSSSSSSDSRTSPRSSRTNPRSSNPRRPEPSQGTTDVSSAGESSKFIAQVIEDDRTNSLIVLANEDGHTAVRELLDQIDRDVDVGGEIHVVYLEHAKATDVASVLSALSQGHATTPSGQGRRGQTGGPEGRPGAPNTPGRPGTPTSPATRTTPPVVTAGGEDGEGSALSAFDSGMRIAADESTNSLVIIASQADFQVVQRVIDKLDVERKQVYVDAVVLELSSDDALNLGLAGHIPVSLSNDAAGFIGSELGATSLGLTQDALSGLAMGVFGKGVDVPTIGADGLPAVLSVPAFGIALNAIKSTGSTNIIGNPSLMTLDNEEASIVIGRKIPFPTTSGLNNLGQPVISFQREDVATTLKITPRVNSSNYVTLDLELEVQEVEDSAQSAQTSAAGGGFITSQRKLDTVALVADNETMVIGGLVGTTDGKSESKVPVLGDIPVIGALFRSTKSTSRKTNMMVFLTPHIIDEPDDMIEVQRVKEAQREEFLRRFYGKSKSQYWDELEDLLRYSMNFVDERSVYRGPSTIGHDLELDGESMSTGSIQDLQDAANQNRKNKPGDKAGQLPDDQHIDIEDNPTPAPAPAPAPK